MKVDIFYSSVFLFSRLAARAFFPSPYIITQGFSLVNAFLKNFWRKIKLQKECSFFLRFSPFCSDLLGLKK